MSARRAHLASGDRRHTAVRPHRRDAAIVGAAGDLTDVERDRLLRSVIASQALEGVAVSYAAASRLLDDVLREPLPDIG
jgi:hypothetical protein